jgi:hypothetical protein
MTEILQDLSFTNLIRANEANLSSWITVLGPLGEVKWNNPPGVNRSVCPIPMPLFNSVVDTQLKPEDVDATINYIKSDADQRNVPALWWVGPSTRPGNLGEILTRSGFFIDEDGRGMAVDLSRLNQGLPRPASLDIQPVIGEAAIHEWCLALGKGFEVPESRRSFVSESWGMLLSLADTKCIRAFLAKMDGQPVATSLLLLGAGVAGIYAVTTIPDARRMGIGAQVTCYPLLVARDEGYKIGILQSSEMGYKMYCSIGFEQVCRITSYMYRPETS